MHGLSTDLRNDLELHQRERALVACFVEGDGLELNASRRQVGGVELDGGLGPDGGRRR